MLKFTSFKRQEINLVFKIKVFVGSKIKYLKIHLFLVSKKFGLLHFYNRLELAFHEVGGENVGGGGDESRG
jgi:hypothetical protein